MTPPSKHAIPNEPSTGALAIVGSCGLLLLFGTLLWAAYVSWTNPEAYGGIWRTLLAHLFGGRPGSAELGLVMGLGFWELVRLQVVLDTIMMLMAYSLFAGGFRLAEKLPFVGQALLRFHASVAAQGRRVRRYGAVGLFCFVLLPLPSTGPLAGTVAGYLMGFRTWAALALVTSGNVVGIVGWTRLWQEIREISPWLTWSILLLLVGAIVYGMARTLYYYLLSLNEPPPPTAS